MINLQILRILPLKFLHDVFNVIFNLFLNNSICEFSYLFVFSSVTVPLYIYNTFLNINFQRTPRHCKKVATVGIYAGDSEPKDFNDFLIYTVEECAISEATGFTFR